MDCSLAGSSVHGIFQARVLEWGAISLKCCIFMKLRDAWFLALEKEITTHSSTLAWKIPWMDEPVKLWPLESQRVRYD